MIRKADGEGIAEETSCLLPVVLGLGSNRGEYDESRGGDPCLKPRRPLLDNCRGIILAAVKELEGVLVHLRRASLYETNPLHVTDQGRFINTAVAGFYPVRPDRNPLLSARELLSRVHEIERRFGRDRSRERRWGERTLDIDILLFADITLDTSDLTIPHPRLKERRFALEPLLELLPDAAEPGTGISYRGICDALPEQGVDRL